MKKLSSQYPIRIICRVLEVSRSGYYSWLNRNDEITSRNARLLFDIKRVFRMSGKTYGYRCIFNQLKQEGIDASISLVRRLMRENKIFPKNNKHYIRTTDSKHNLDVAPNLLERNFYVDKPNMCWVSDITYIWTVTGWLYLSVFIDLFSRRVVGWSMDSNLNRSLVINAYDMAVNNRRPAKGLIVHSDRGSQYASNDFKEYLSKTGAIQSMSRKGDCWDNAVAESFFASLKKERVYGSNYKNQKEAKLDIFDYIEVFYNRIRLHSTNGYLSPMRFENNYEYLLKAA